MARTYQAWEEYKQNKLASIQADRMYDTLMKMRKNKVPTEQYHEYYRKMYETHLYNKHGALYCQVLSDVNYSC